MKRIRYSIRDLCWLTLVVSLLVGWTVDHKELTDAIDTLTVYCSIKEDGYCTFYSEYLSKEKAARIIALRGSKGIVIH